MIKVLFFAQVRELVGCDELSFPCEYANAEALRTALCERGDKWALALEAGKLLVAVNQTLVPLDTVLVDGDEVAFFPPVTGG
ncbi:MAG: molybdopterin synthase sulfur carrier subunit [Aeromonadaceae bacterium]|jgi:molybdopterin synthase sulfur carrier subunit|uniref:Molybdopterin synthase sulfur carrier subunit n=1 Tax=Aeromonas media TaxID=651 RepID=A0AAW5RPB9_AERME|nr:MULTISPECIES: molybdopterin synthase sulfur carrier subunit [Aeromonas]MBP8220119.1 molybdopterin synthase sulfur carrier subunit [Aeromonadaceae bacterium]MBP8279469.1 molybdopterin synthase sulfur carrier subunit [Aeromonas sp.]MCV3290480.1 molybdopterin synthase sulfur carrier subunit [Aeromonas media]QQQ15927.1 molybdopterin synthase sulfur carrier subunit [Aeromonas media]RDD48316.1 molybdopterin synthase sulfur carrier subunit [Aeromonas sp. ARM81]